MKKRTKKGLDFVIDKLTNSIENIKTGDSFTTNIIHLTKADLTTIAKKNGWVFDWKYELRQGIAVCKAMVGGRYSSTGWSLC